MDLGDFAAGLGLVALPVFLAGVRSTGADAPRGEVVATSGAGRFLVTVDGVAPDGADGDALFGGDGDTGSALLGLSASNCTLAAGAGAGAGFDPGVLAKNDSRVFCMMLRARMIPLRTSVRFVVEMVCPDFLAFCV